MAPRRAQRGHRPASVEGGAVKNALLTAICLTMILALSACGYSFRGGQNNLLPDVRAIAIPVFKNNTAELRIERIFTDQLIYQFTKSQMVRIVPEADADAVLRGTITGALVDDVALTTDETSRERRITVTVAAKLTRTDNGQVLWQNPGLAQNRKFSVGGSPQVTDANKQEAVIELADAMMQTLHDNVLENF